MTVAELFSNRGEYGQGASVLQSDLFAAADAREAPDMAALRANYARRGMTGSGIEQLGMKDFFVNRDAQRRGMSLQAMNAVTPYAEMDARAAEAEKERQWQKYMYDLTRPKKSKAWIGALGTLAGTYFTRDPTMGMARGTSYQSPSSDVGYTWG